MNAVIFTGPTCYLGQWHFTRGKIYEIHTSTITSNFIVEDNDMKYYINKKEWECHWNNRNFITLDKWRELQINKILNYE